MRNDKRSNLLSEEIENLFGLEEADRSKTGLDRELAILEKNIWLPPMIVLSLFGLTGSFYLILLLIEKKDMFPDWLNSVFIIAGVLSVFCSIRPYIEYSALKKYLQVLKLQKSDVIVEYGRQYYSIKRKGFLGLDGHGYNIDDDDLIGKDIETYCSN